MQSLISGTVGNATQSAQEIADQAELINSNVVGEAVQRRLREDRRLGVAAGTAQAISSTTGDFIEITARAGTAEGAALLANTYAQVYLGERGANYRRQVQAVLTSASKQLQSSEKKHSAVHSQVIDQALAERINQLQSDLTLGSTGDKQINPAIANPVALSPRPKRNALFGFALGIVLASFAAYALSRFDRRLRSLADIEEAFQTQILTALPSIKDPIVRRDSQRMPAEPLREPLRRLHTTLQLRGLLDHDRETLPRSILFVSAEAGAGKSTLIASLALVQRDAGERVAVIEADLRRPVQAGLLDVDGSYGLAEVLAGTLPVSEALQRVDSSLRPSVETGLSGAGEGVATAVESRGGGSVSVLVSGGEVANPPALLAGRAMAGLLHSVADDFDHVLIDAPPPLEVSDIMPLLHVVDAIVIVARVGHTKAASTQRLVQLLARASSAPVLGVVANDVAPADIEASGFSSAYYDRR